MSARGVWPEEARAKAVAGDGDLKVKRLPVTGKRWRPWPREAKPCLSARKPSRRRWHAISNDARQFRQSYRARLRCRLYSILQALVVSYFELSTSKDHSRSRRFLSSIWHSSMCTRMFFLSSSRSGLEAKSFQSIWIDPLSGWISRSNFSASVIFCFFAPP